jgi:putative serine protease PepD
VPNTISSDTLLAVERATVKLEIIGKDGESAGWGSGSIIDPHGMILTNAHVADPNALGQTTQYGSPPHGKTPDYLLVDLRGSNADGTVVPRYRARKVVSDGYLDLAIVQIYADAKGNKIDPASLELPTVQIGDSDSLSVGDEVTVVGFPGVSQSRAATVTKGDASAFVRDARLKSDRAWIETTARIAHGNSGGAAVDATGALVGVPTRLAPEHEGDVGWWVRPVNWAKRLITLARNHQGEDYVTPYVTPASGVTITPLDWTETRDAACASDPNPYVAHTGADTTEMYVGVQISGLAKGLTLNISINGPVGSSTDLTATSDGPDQGCYSVPVSFDKGNGRYVVVFSVDPPGTSTQYAAIVVGD